ncbi:MAG: PAS domain-containing protein [Polyangiaceae bacterium]|nr:PAS domain-containing protein [Polyangiaceae bacterium]
MLDVVMRAELPAEAASQSPFPRLARLRWVALAGITLTLTVAGPVLGRLPSGTAPWLWAVTGALAVYNAAITWGGAGASRLGSPGAQITLDCVALASLVHLAGGLENPFLALFTLHVVNASVVLSGRGARRVLALAIGLITVIAVGEGRGLLPHHCVSPRAASHALDLDALAKVGGLALTLLILSSFTRFLTARLRKGRGALLATVTELHGEKDALARARADVETERSRLQAVVDCMQDAVTFVDPGGAVLFRNQRALALWPQREDGPPAGSLEEVARGAASAPVTFERGARVFEAARSPVESAEGETLGLVIVARDITERRAIERRMMQDEQMSVVGRLAASVAHEINNPIGVISLYSEHALAKLPTGPVREHLETIHRNAEACGRIVGGLLDLARPHRPERRAVNLRRLCREIVDSLRPLAERAGVRISPGEDDDEPVLAHADPGLLRQAVLNLAVNAVEATGADGDVVVRAYSTPDRADGLRHVIEVRDGGPGIARAELERLFQPFFTTKQAGTGLGLSIADSVVKGHHGRIDVESELDRGTVFRVLLPELSPEVGR